MKIGILGSGAVGRTLGTAFLKEGYDVMLGTRHPEKEDLIKWTNDNPGGNVGLFDETADFGDLLILATSGSITEDVVHMADITNFTGKTIIDATNPIAPGGPDQGVLKFFTTNHDSLMERLQKLLPDSKLVKAFNSVGSGFMYKPDFGGNTPSMFICGDDAEAKKTVSDILEKFGWEVEDMGGVASARAIEPLCILWCLPGFLHNRWSHAFKLLKA